MKVKLILTALIISITIPNAYSANEYLLTFKPNKNLKYKLTIGPIPKHVDSSFLKYLRSQLSQISLLKISYTESKNGNLNAFYDLNIWKKKSCCNPLTYPAYMYNFHGIIESSIEPSGHVLNNKKGKLKLGCVLGFNLWTIISRQKLEGKLIPCYFPKQKVKEQSNWKNEFEFQEDKKKKTATIEYTLINIDNKTAFIEGIIDRTGITLYGEFDTEKGYWKTFKIFYLNRDKKITLRSFDLI